MGLRPRVVKEVMVGDSRVMQPYTNEQPGSTSEVVAAAPVAAAPVAAVLPSAAHIFAPVAPPKPDPRIQSATSLARWAVVQDATDVPWDDIKAILGEPPYETAFKPKRIRVQMTGGGLGKVTLFVTTFSASPTLVILGFPLDGQTSIIEPPPAGADDPIVLVVEGKTYRCLSGGWSTEVRDQLLVALPVVPTETA